MASRTQIAYEQLREELLTCQFEPGQRLGIIELCQHMNVSQGAVREALSRLTSEGLVESEAQRGFKVPSVSATDLLHLTTARAEIDSLCLKRSIEVGGLEWESRIVAAFHRLDNTPERDENNPKKFSIAYINAHDQFQETLVSACDNPWLSRLRNILHTQAKRYQGLSEPGKSDMRKELRALMDACINKDGKAAEKLLSEHMLNRAKTLIRHLTTDDETQASEFAKVR
jgi:DNA-binding GntR family transcriptional regulator